jgi:hypothetical protein
VSDKPKGIWEEKMMVCVTGFFILAPVSDVREQPPFAHPLHVMGFETGAFTTKAVSVLA